jgi:hypothetical protein
MIVVALWCVRVGRGRVRMMRMMVLGAGDGRVGVEQDRRWVLQGRHQVSASGNRKETTLPCSWLNVPALYERTCLHAAPVLRCVALHAPIPIASIIPVFLLRVPATASKAARPDFGISCSTYTTSMAPSCRIFSCAVVRYICVLLRNQTGLSHYSLSFTSDETYCGESRGNDA